jgi:hypothetical protein
MVKTVLSTPGRRVSGFSPNVYTPNAISISYFSSVDDERGRGGGDETGIVNKIKPNGRHRPQQENKRYTPIMETSIAVHNSSSGSGIAETPAAQDENTLGHE